MRYSWLALILLCTNAFAMNSYYCINTGKVINLGQHIADVTTACGPPTIISSREDKIETPITLTQWIYGIPVDKAGLIPTLRVTFDENNLVSKIDKSGIVLNSLFCNINGMIKNGDAQATVRLACGAPALINSIATTKSSVKTINEWTYNFGPYQPQIIFEFDGDTLTQIKTGSLGN